MALTKPKIKEILSAAGVPAENMDAAITELMSGHLASIEALREERDGYKVDAEKLPAVQKELDELKAQPDDGYKAKYEAEKEAHDKLKASIAKETADREKSTLYRAVLDKAGIDPKRVDAIMRVTDLDKLTVKDGKLDGEDKLIESAKTDWADFAVTKGSKGANPDNPPDNRDKSTFAEMTLADKMKYANEHPTDAAVQEWLKE